MGSFWFIITEESQYSLAALLATMTVLLLAGEDGILDTRDRDGQERDDTDQNIEVELNSALTFVCHNAAFTIKVALINQH